LNSEATIHEYFGSKEGLLFAVPGETSSFPRLKLPAAVNPCRFLVGLSGSTRLSLK
jgi:hypothetical protein